MARLRPFVYESGQGVPGTELRIVRPIGYGGGGSVYEVEHSVLKRHYVIKVIHREFLVGRNQKDVEREARILARFEHEHIVKIHGAGWTADRKPLFYFMMEKLEGHLLRSLIHWSNEEGERLPIEFALNTAACLFRALGSAHALGIVHRDVKPENVIIHRADGARWVPKLIDFGVGKIMAEARTTLGFSGTYRYAAPEQLDGRGTTPASDIYAAALVFYEMLVGHGPFAERESDLQIAEAHLNEESPPPSRFADVPPRLDELIVRLLDKDPARRGAECRPIVKELEQIQVALCGSSSRQDPAQFVFLDQAHARRQPGNASEPRSSSSPDGGAASGSQGLSQIHLLASSEQTIPDARQADETGPVSQTAEKATVVNAEPAELEAERGRTEPIPQATLRLPHRVPAAATPAQTVRMQHSNTDAALAAAEPEERTARGTLKIVRPPVAPREQRNPDLTAPRVVIAPISLPAAAPARPEQAALFRTTNQSPSTRVATQPPMAELSSQEAPVAIFVQPSFAANSRPVISTDQVQVLSRGGAQGSREQYRRTVPLATWIVGSAAFSFATALLVAFAFSAKRSDIVPLGSQHAASQTVPSALPSTGEPVRVASSSPAELPSPVVEDAPSVTPVPSARMALPAHRHVTLNAVVSERERPVEPETSASSPPIPARHSIY